MNHFSWQSAIIKTSKLSPSARLVLLVIGSYMNQHGEGAWPSYATITLGTGLAERTAKYAVKEACEAGWLVKEGRYDAKGGQLSNVYRVSFPDDIGKKDAVQNIGNGGAEAAQGGSEECMGGVHGMHQGGASAAPKHTIEHTNIDIQSNNIRHAKKNTSQDNISSAEGKKLSTGKPATKRKTTLTADDLIDRGVDEQVAADYITHRKAKRAPVTETVITNIQHEALKARISLEQALALCVARGWQGFNASWLETKQHNTGYASQRDESRRVACNTIGVGQQYLAPQAPQYAPLPDYAGGMLYEHQLD